MHLAFVVSLGNILLCEYAAQPSSARKSPRNSCYDLSLLLAEISEQHIVLVAPPASEQNLAEVIGRT